MEKIKVGIFFGGPSREREISFAGGRTVYDNLNKSIFEPIPIFVDSNKKFILLNWEYVYKGSIRDFYPPVDFLKDDKHGFQIYIESLGLIKKEEYNNLISQVGREILPSQFYEEFDFAFLALHGLFGEDGQIQSMLEMIGMPYSGSGVLACAMGMDKSEQKKYMEVANFNCPTMQTISREEWMSGDKSLMFAKFKKVFGDSMVIRPANQGSSIGVSILHKIEEVQFIERINKAFFILQIDTKDWDSWALDKKIESINRITDIREGIGFPMSVGGKTLHHPDTLLNFLDSQNDHSILQFEGHNRESKVIVESFLKGKEFSCIVVRNMDGTTTSLPPTEIKKEGQLYDYKSKYLPGLSRKVTPIDLPQEEIQKIRQECQRLYSFLGFNTYARIDGFYTESGEVFLNDPNTTSGMMPSSFFFHQAAEIGLNPSQFLSFIIWTSIKERKENQLFDVKIGAIEGRLASLIANLQDKRANKTKVAVLLGGYSFERHISVESGRNIYEKLASSEKYEPIPIFLMGLEDGGYDLYQIPINLLLKDNADDIKHKILNYSQHPIVKEIQLECEGISNLFGSNLTIDSPKKTTFDLLSNQVDAVFIALHGRPGEDGNVQKQLLKVGLPFNGSPYHSSETTIDKYATLQLLKKHGFTVTKQRLISKADYNQSIGNTVNEIESEFNYPFVVKPVDDGCSSAVVIIKTRERLKLYLKILFRETTDISLKDRTDFGLSYNEEFPYKNRVLIEDLITPNDCFKFLEITGGLLTHRDGNKITYEIFEPSETLSTGEVLSLEEKFLAGEGQNITPARFATNKKDYLKIAQFVKKDLLRAAKILEVEGYGRIDAFVRIFEDQSVETIIIEVNSLPGMTPATCIFHQCSINGYKPYEFIDSILTFAMRRKGNFVAN